MATIKMLRKHHQGTRVLVIAPLRVCELVWPKERDKWTDFNGLTMAFLHGPNKAQALAQKADISLINPEGLDWLADAQKTRTPTGKTKITVDPVRWKSLGFDMLIVDELSKFKHTNTQRFKIMRHIIPLFGRRVGLTGSPASNGLLDLFGQCFVIDEGRTFGKYITQYRLHYFEPVDKNQFVWELKKGAEDEIYKRVAPIALRMSAEDYLDMPTLIPNRIYVDLPPKAQKIYDQLENDLIARVNKNVVTAANAAVASVKCLAEGTEVLTVNGWKRIELCSLLDRVWDGVEWVKIGGSVCNGYKDVVECHGVRMTHDHRVLTVSGWKTAQEILDGQSSNRYDRATVWVPRRDRQSREQKDIWFVGFRSLVDQVRLWKDNCLRRTVSASQETRSSQIMRLPTWRDPRSCAWDSRHVPYHGVHQMAWNGPAVHQSENQRVGVLRRSWHYGMQKVANLYRILERHGAGFFAGVDVGAKECSWSLHQKELLLGDDQRAKQQYAKDYSYQDSKWQDDTLTGRRTLRATVHHAAPKNFPSALDDSQSMSTPRTKVYDLVDAGPRQRFVVRGYDGRMLIVHNCRQVANGGIYLDPEVTAMGLKMTGDRKWTNIHTAKVDALADLIDELQGSPVLVAYDFEHDLDRLKEKFGDDIPYIGGGIKTERAKELEKLWNSGKLPALFAHPQSVAYGLNLQERAHHVCWHSMTWNYEHYDQFIRRVRRQGNSASRVFVHHIMAKGTVDEIMMDAMEKKEKGQQAFFDGLMKLAQSRKSRQTSHK